MCVCVWRVNSRRLQFIFSHHSRANTILRLSSVRPSFFTQSFKNEHMPCMCVFVWQCRFMFTQPDTFLSGAHSTPLSLSASFTADDTTRPLRTILPDYCRQKKKFTEWFCTKMEHLSLCIHTRMNTHKFQIQHLPHRVNQNTHPSSKTATSFSQDCLTKAHSHCKTLSHKTVLHTLTHSRHKIFLTRQSLKTHISTARPFLTRL